MMQNPTDKDFWVKEIYIWQTEYLGSFCSMLLDSFQKADSHNKIIVDSAYPGILRAWVAWQASGDAGNDLFREHDLLPK